MSKLTAKCNLKPETIFQKISKTYPFAIKWQDCHAHFKFSVEQARVSIQSLATKVCEELVFYIRIIDI